MDMKETGKYVADSLRIRWLRQRWRAILVALALPGFMGAVLPQCARKPSTDLKASDFVQVSKNGFGYVENWLDLNDYPWGLTYFKPDDAPQGHVYVSTGNGIDEQVLYALGQYGFRLPPLRPGEVRRYRPDIGPRNWQSVLDIRNYENGPVFSTTGFRSLEVYKPASGGHPTYLYAGSMSETPALWRSSTGDVASWEVVWIYRERGSIRAMVVHDGILYFSVIPGGEIGDGTPGAIYAHDGDNTWLIENDGFGNPDNESVWTMVSFNGYVYASVANRKSGFEVWKFAGSGDKAGPPIRVIENGACSSANGAAATSIVFKNHVYFGTQVFAGINMSGDGGLLRGGDLVRLDADDRMEVVIGPDSISGIGSGFNRSLNAYMWSMEEYKGDLYVGTWDQSTFYQYIVDEFPQSLQDLLALLSSGVDLAGIDISGVKTEAADSAPGDKRSPTILSVALDMGGDLYRTRNGAKWDTIFTDGLGNPYNYGPRNILAVGDDIYVGMANPYEGFEIWRATTRPVETEVIEVQ